MTRTDDDVALDAVLDPLVLALDIGSTATRGGVHDASGRRVHGLQHKVPHAFTVAPDGTSVIDPDQVTAEVEQVLDAVTGDPRLGTRIAGVAMDTFAASLIAVEVAGRARTPCLTYADSRSADAVTALREELDEHAVQQRTGTRLHTSYHAPRLRWFAAVQPRVVAEAALCGRWASTSWLGWSGTRWPARPRWRGPACSTVAPASWTPSCSLPRASAPSGCPRRGMCRSRRLRRPELGQWDFHLAVAPVRFAGTSGSPVNPIATF